VRVEAGYDVDDPLAIAGLDEMELTPAQPAARRVDINAEDRAHPGLGLKQ
jgi:hypothetical protein